MNRGDIFWINLEPAQHPEMGKVRPGLIISNTEQNLLLNTLVVLPISSKSPEIWPLRIELTGLKKKSFVVVPAIRQVNKNRLLEKMGQIQTEQLKKIDEALWAYLQD